MPIKAGREWEELGAAIKGLKRAVLGSMPFLPRMAGKFACLLGHHSPAAETLKLAPDDRYDVWGRQVSFCGRCRKILFIGYFPLEHPNCRCQTIDPGDDDPGLPAPKEIIHEMMEAWQKKEDKKWS